MAYELTTAGRAILDDVDASAKTIHPFEGKNLQFMDARDFLAQDFHRRFLVERVLTEGEPAIFGGPRKTLKTSFSIDLAVSMASGTPFLGKFKVPVPVPVGIISGESGGATLKNTFQRVCAAKGIDDPNDLPVHFMLELPSLTVDEELDVVCEAVKKRGLRAIVVDPLYLSLLAGGGSANTSNLYEMGPLLSKVSQRFLKAGATPILVHHFKKGGNQFAKGGYRPPELDDLSGSGVAEFARQWLLIGHRKPYDTEAGRHCLWLVTGGSAGHGSTWGVDVIEGKLKEDFSGRIWQVEIRREGEQYEHDREERSAQQMVDTLAQETEDREALIETLKRYPEGETQSALLEEAGISRRKGQELFRKLRADRRIESCRVRKPGGRGDRDYDGYRLVESERPTEAIEPDVMMDEADE